ncbi:MAG: helix-turn-helix transcriptional regulator [Thermoleophilia bacterium]
MRTFKQLRKARGITQTELSACVGCARSYIALIETGRRKPADLLARIATALGMTLPELEAVVDPQEPQEPQKEPLG